MLNLHHLARPLMTVLNMVALNLRCARGVHSTSTLTIAIDSYITCTVAIALCTNFIGFMSIWVPLQIAVVLCMLTCRFVIEDRVARPTNAAECLWQVNSNRQNSLLDNSPKHWATTGVPDTRIRSKEILQESHSTSICPSEICSHGLAWP